MSLQLQMSILHIWLAEVQSCVASSFKAKQRSSSSSIRKTDIAHVQKPSLPVVVTLISSKAVESGH
jgi:hypothetical protein